MSPLRLLSNLLRRRQAYGHISSAIEQHLEEKIADLMDRGLSQSQAETQARREFGNPSLIEERSREIWLVPFVDSTLADFRFGMRSLLKAPGFAVTAVAVLALGLAASTSIFAYFNAALLKQLPYREPSRLVAVVGSSPTCPTCDLSYLDFQDLSHGGQTFRSLAIWSSDAYLWRSPAGTQALRVGRVSGDFFTTLGVTPALGRLFSAVDDSASSPRAVVLPYATWVRDFGSRADVLGQPINLDNSTYNIIGVLPRTFEFAPRAAELWVTIHDLGDCEHDRSCKAFSGIARLNDGVTVPAAAAAMRTLAANVAIQNPQTNKDQSVAVLTLRESFAGDVRPVLYTLFLGASLLLVIALTNIATLLLVRGEARRREMALRQTLGASFTRLFRQLASEAALLVALSVPIGIGAAWVAIHLFAPLIPERLLRGMPFFVDVALDRNVLLFSLCISLTAWITCALAPAARLPRNDQQSSLASGVRVSRSTWRRVSSTLVVAEVSLAVALLASAGLLSKSLYRILHTDINFNPAHLATLEIDANTGFDTPAQQLSLSRDLIAAVNGIPGVRSVGTVRSLLPVSANSDPASYRVMGREWRETHPPVLSRTVSDQYLQTLQTPLLKGRYFAASDDAAHPAAAIINSTMARQYFPGEDPIGRTIGDAKLSPASLRQVVGVIEDIHEGALTDPQIAGVYVPFEQNPAQNFFLVARTVQDPVIALSSIVSVIHHLDPQLGLRNEAVMTQHIHDSPAAYFRTISAVLLSAFSACATVLSAIGLYGVMAYSVGQRQREIGIRMALGAQRSQIGRLVLREGAQIVVVGLLFGALAAIISGHLLASLLFNVRPYDVSVLTLVMFLLTFVSLVAAWLPARRAASVSPEEALRTE